MLRLTAWFLIFVALVSADQTKLPVAKISAYDDGFFGIVLLYEGSPEKVGIDYCLNEPDFEEYFSRTVYRNLQDSGQVGLGSARKFGNHDAQIGDVIYYKVYAKKDGVVNESAIRSHRVTEILPSATRAFHA